MALPFEIASDVRFTFRLFRRNLSFSLVAIASLALGIGASSAIFSLIYAVLLNPYPYRAADRMVMPTFTDREGWNGTMDYTVADFQDFVKQSQTMQGAVLSDRTERTLTGGIPNRFRFIVTPQTSSTSWECQRS